MPGKKHKFQYWKSLAMCTVCGAGEGELLRWCPGYRLTREALEACYTGNVVDFERYKERREYEESESATEW